MLHTTWHSLFKGLSVAAALVSSANAQADGPALGDARIRQSDVVGGALSLQDIRRAGMVVFSTPFNRLDGYGDGPVDLADPLSPGGRPTLQGNGTFLRVNGLDAQSCLECHSSASNRTIPFRFGVGGHGAAKEVAVVRVPLINGIASTVSTAILPPDTRTARSLISGWKRSVRRQYSLISCRIPGISASLPAKVMGRVCQR